MSVTQTTVKKQKKTVQLVVTVVCHIGYVVDESASVQCGTDSQLDHVRSWHAYCTTTSVFLLLFVTFNKNLELRSSTVYYFDDCNPATVLFT